MTGATGRFFGTAVRRMVLALTLVSQILGAVGLPVPTPRSKPAGDTPYPCQSRPCGCLTSEQCWAGDCCCFTLEEKLRWAEANGVEPPEHVRPLVESRQQAPKPPKKKACCCEAEPAPAAEPPCCQPATECAECSGGCDRCAAAPTPACCDAAQHGEPAVKSDCPNCPTKPKAGGCESKRTSAPSSGVKWVLGIYAKTCRGLGPDGLFELDPVVFPAPVLMPQPEPALFHRPVSTPVCSTTSAPPVPPPRD